MANWQVDAQGNMFDVDALKPGYSWNPNNGQITYDDSWNKNPLTAVGYQTYDNAGNLGYVTAEQAREQSKTPYTVASVDQGWAAAAADPQFWDKYSGIVVPHTATKATTYWQDGQSSTVDTNDLLSGDGGFGGWMNQNLNAANWSEYVEPINRYVGPMVLPAVMAAGGAMIGGPIGGMLIGGTLGTAVGAGIGASTYGAIDSVDKGDYLGAATKVGTSILGAYAGANLLGDALSAAPGSVDYTSLAGDAFAAPTFTVDPSLALNSGLVTPDITSGFANYMGSTGADLASIYNTPSFTPDPTLANNVTLPSLTPDAIPAPTYSNALTPTPEFQVNPALAPDAPAFSVDPSLDAFSNTLPELDPNYQSTAARDQIVDDTVNKFAKGLLSSGNKANAALPTFQTNFTPLSSQAFGNTGNSWATNKAGQSGLQGSTFKDAPFKGSYLMNGQDDQNLTSYLADYLPLNASKKMKDFSSFVA